MPCLGGSTSIVSQKHNKNKPSMNKLARLQNLQRWLNDQSSSGLDGRYSLEFQQCLSWPQEQGDSVSAKDVWSSLSNNNKNDDYDANANDDDDDDEEEEDGFSEFQSAWNKGYIVPMMTTSSSSSATSAVSYVVYRVCPTDQCQRTRNWRGRYRNNQQDELSFFGMTTLEQYISHTRYQSVNQRLDYCQACQNGLAFYDNDRDELCQGTSMALQEQLSSQAGDDFFRQVVVNGCDESCSNQCPCFDNSGDDYCYDTSEEVEGQILNAMETMVKMDGGNNNDDGGDNGAGTPTCIATGENYQWNKNDQGAGSVPLYAGITCNQDGTGWDVALFLDSSCSLYTSLASFSDLMRKQQLQENFYDDDYYNYNINNNNDDANGVDLEEVYSILSTTAANDLVTASFVRRVNCANLEYIYTSNDETEANDDGNGNVQYYSSSNMNEYCQGVVLNSIDLASCDQASGNINNGQRRRANDANDNYNNNNQVYGDSNTIAILQSTCQQIQQDYSGSIEKLLRNHKNPYRFKGSGAMFDYDSSSLGRRGGQSYPYYALVELIVVIIVGAVVALAVRDMTMSSSPWSRFLWSQEEREQEKQRRELLVASSPKDLEHITTPQKFSPAAKSTSNVSLYSPPTPHVPQSPATHESASLAAETGFMPSPRSTTTPDKPQLSFSDPPHPQSSSSSSQFQEEPSDLPNKVTSNSSGNLKIHDSEDGEMVIRGMCASFKSLGSSTSSTGAR